jgi:hypothetical protein
VWLPGILQALFLQDTGTEKLKSTWATERPEKAGKGHVTHGGAITWLHPKTAERLRHDEV